MSSAIARPSSSVADTAAAQPWMLLLQQLAQDPSQSSQKHAVCITARIQHGLQSVDVPQALLAFVLEGSKQVRCDGAVLELVAGQMLVVQAGVRIDAVNRPDATTGRYCTLGVPLCEQVLSAARLLWEEEVVQHAGPAIASYWPAEFAGHVQAWAEALLQGDYASARAALVAQVIALCRQGMTGLMLTPPPTLAMQVRQLVQAQPARAWMSRDFEALLGISGATLRRRLASEGTSLRTVLLHARMGYALDLLYTTRLPLKSVAARVGYQTTDSFAKAFRMRYGMDPSDIGNSTV